MHGHNINLAVCVCLCARTPHFGGLNRHFKPNMRNIQNLQICVSDCHEISQAAAASNRDFVAIVGGLVWW